MEEQLEDRLEDFLNRNEILDELHRLSTEGKRSLVVDFDDILEYDMDLADELLKDPLNFFEFADEVLEDITEIPRFHLRVKNLSETTEVRGIRSEDVGEFIQIQGIMTRASDVKPEVEIATFKCLRCGELNKVQQASRDFRKPQVCQNPNCSKKGPFRLQEQKSEFRDWQSLRVQELPEKLRGGRIPRYINAIARDDLVDEAVPGNQVIITGTLKAFQETQQNKKKTTFQKVLDVNNVIVKEKSVEETELSSEDEEWIEDLKENHRVRNLVINSVAPSIFGYERIKEAIALQLFGSPPVELPDESRIRGDSHILLTGDPGTAKSQLLKWANKVAPRSVYTSGKKSTGAGLCVTGDTLVHTEDGFEEIGKLVREEINFQPEREMSKEYSKKIYTFNGDEINAKESSLIWRMPEKGCVKIETSFGKEIEASKNTKLLTCGNSGIKWKKVTELEPGDYVASPDYSGIERTNISPRYYYEFDEENLKLSDRSSEEIREMMEGQFGALRDAASELGLSEDFVYGGIRKRYVPFKKLETISERLGIDTDKLDFESVMLRHGDEFTLPGRFDEDLMYLIGFVFGAGDISLSDERGLVRISNSNKEVLEYLREIIMDKFGKKVDIEEQEGKVPCLRLYSKTIAKFFENIGMRTPKNELSLDKHLTTHVNSDAFLRGLFDADGCVVSRENGSESVQYSTISSKLAKQVQLMLETYGIKSERRTGDSKGSERLDSGQETETKSTQSHLMIRGEDIDEFSRHIGFDVRKKFDSLISITDTKRNSNIDVMPVSGLLEESATGVGAHASYFTRRKNPGVKKATQIPQDVELEPEIEKKLGEVVRSDLKWEKVSKTEETGKKRLYDLTVPKTHNFIGNGIITHNTAAAVRDEMTGGWTLEAGALAIGDGGLACIDEFDKMSDEESGAILESMEQQTISVAKAGIVATLNTRTAILAAANPRLGRFDRYDPIPQQIDLPALILSRFDLMFILRDIPKEERDRNLADHMLNLQSSPEEVVKPELDREKLRKLIIYARKYVNPKFRNEEAKKKLEDFFVQWRGAVGGDSSEGDEAVPITARQLEALVRLAKSNARLRLSEEVTVDDADKAIDLFRESLRQLGLEEESGKPDIDILMTGHSRSQHEKLQRVMEIIDELEDDYGDGAPIKTVKEEARADGIEADFVEEIIRQEKRNGRLYEPSEGLISRAT
ncbi:MAG: LAGLIDADG family homing endonuclease [Candidatus Hadarchaeota archaeon]